MPAITVTAVSTGADTLTAVGHGLVTGGRFRLRNVGGALPASTPSLAGVTDYFAIRVDADTVKVAVSSSDAFAGTAVNLTGSGSGTTTVEYGLPFCIPTALAAPGTQIKSANDTGAWNALVALHAMLTGQSQSIWNILGELPHGDVVLNLPPYALMSTTATPQTGNVALGTGDAYLGIPLLEGDRLKSIAITVAGNGTADVDIILHVNDAAGGQSAPSGGSATVTNPGSAATTTINPTDTVLGAGETFRLQFTPNATGITIGNVRVTYDRPAP